MITNRNELQPGTRLEAKYRDQHYEAVVEADTYTLTLAPERDLQGRSFKSLSRAANAITGNSVNGWRFWSLAGTETLEAAIATGLGNDDEWTAGTPDPTDAEEEAWQIGPNDAPGLEDQVEFDGRPAPHQGQPTKLLRNIKRTANQRGIPASEVRWWCNACMKSFLAPEGRERPDTCPDGHPAMVQA